ncbi:MAG: hypothetical protein ABFR90_09580 [Planctomycetota bacterium]
MVFIGLKKDPQVNDFLNIPGIVERFKDKAGTEVEKEDKISPLVAQAKAFALRIDPPPPPKPPAPIVKPKPPVEVARTPVSTVPRPKAPVSLKSDLLATVVYESSPDRSLALLQTASNKQEWFRQGEKVGHLEIQEIRDGSVVFTQGGQNPKEKFVPPKPQVKSLLKGEQNVSMVPAATSAAVQTPIPGPKTRTDAASAAKPDTASSTPARAVRPIDRASRPESDASDRIRRVRSVPTSPPPQEHKESLEETMSGIEAIMNRQDDSISAEEREKEKEMWMHMMRELNAEKERLEQQTGAQAGSEADAAKAEADSSEKDAKAKSAPADKPAAREPRKP